MTVIGLKTSVVFFVVLLSDRYMPLGVEVRCDHATMCCMDPDPHYTFSADFPLRFCDFFLVCSNIPNLYYIKLQVQ